MRSLFSKLSLAKLFRASPSAGEPCCTSTTASIEGLESRNLFSAAVGIDPGFAPSAAPAIRIDPGVALPGILLGGFERKFFTVTNTNDSGPGSLRRAIKEANKAVDSVIEFRIHARFEQDGVFTIKPRHELPALTSTTTVDGSTQVACTGDTNGGRPVVFIDGSRGHATNGLTLLGTSESIKDLGIDNFGSGDGILVKGAFAIDDSVYDCLIGTDPSGTRAAANSGGIAVINSASNTLIGGVGERNIVAGNTGFGIALEGAPGAIVQGNWIGLDSTGAKALGNGTGLFLSDKPNVNTIGGSESAGTANVISGNGVGIETTSALYADPATSGSDFGGNVFGSDAGGSKSVPNTLGNLVHASIKPVDGTAVPYEIGPVDAMSR